MDEVDKVVGNEVADKELVGNEVEVADKVVVANEQDEIG